MRVIAIDPVPGKKSTVFDGAEFLRFTAEELREFIDGIASKKEAVLVCWDAPLTGPSDPSIAGSRRYDFTKRPIERFFSIDETGFKTPKGISVLGYGACSHWTISRSLLGLPRVGPFDRKESRLPLRLLAESDAVVQSRPSVVEVHPALAAWLWCRTGRDSEASWLYKGNKAENRQIRDEMWRIILRRSGFEEALPQPGTDDEFDAAVGYILGRLFTNDESLASRRSYILGDRDHGAFLLPRISGLTDSWVRWKEVAGTRKGHSKRTEKQTEAASTAQSRSYLIGGLHAASRFADEIGSNVKGSASSALGRTRDAAQKKAGAAGGAIYRAGVGSKQALASAAALSEALLATVQGVLASSLATDLNGLLAATVKGSATIYDKAMDAEYLRTFIGGGNHRMFDGGHTIAGAFSAVRDASPDDTIIEEALGFLEAIFRDLTTPKGLPLANWDKATYEQVAAHLQSNFGVPKDWFYDINSYDAVELLGSVIGLIAVVLSWNEKDIEKFSNLVGGMGVTSVFSANPLLLILTVVSLARAFHKAEHSEEYVEVADGLLKGGISAGAALAAASQVAVFGGPAGLALLAGLSAGLLVNHATKTVSVTQFHQFIVERTTAAATEVRKLADAEAGQPNPVV